MSFNAIETPQLMFTFSNNKNSILCNTTFTNNLQNKFTHERTLIPLKAHKKRHP